MIATRDGRSLGGLPRAIAAVDAAARARCDAVRLGAARQGALPWPWCRPLLEHARERGIVLLARPDDEHAVARLAALGAGAFDIAFDMTDLDTIVAAAQTGKPIVLAVDSASDLELAEIVELVDGSSRDGSLALVVPLHDASDLPRIDRLRRLTAEVASEVAIGIAVERDERDAATQALIAAAVARGATIIEHRATNELAGLTG